MNDESLQRANAFLAAVSERIPVGEVLTDTPAEIGRALGMPDALSTARAVRALIARRRLEPANGSYRLLDARPVESGEKESIGRRPRRARGAARPRGERAAAGPTGYSDLGRAVVDKLVDLGRENAQLRAEARTLREEARDARMRADDAERQARTATEKARELENRAEMAEANLRSLLATARGTSTRPDAPVGDAEMAAILGVLKGDESENGSGESVGVISEPTTDPGGEEPETFGSSSSEPAVG
jgi:succinate dehydrogenase/fumarate reductase flavoprotein subunit